MRFAQRRRKKAEGPGSMCLALGLLFSGSGCFGLSLAGRASAHQARDTSVSFGEFGLAGSTGRLGGH